MKLKYKLHPEAFKELDKSLAWYKDQGGIKLATRFFKDYKKTRQKMLKTPLGFPKVEAPLRQIPFEKFPFVIIYYPTNTEVSIIAIFHTSRDPKVWEKRNI